MNRVLVVAQGFALLGQQQVNFVHYVQARPFVSFEFLEDALNLRILLGGDRAAGVRYLEDERGALHFLQRGAKSRDQRVRQVTDKTYRVGEQRLPLGRQSNTPNRRIKD